MPMIGLDCIETRRDNFHDFVATLRDESSQSRSDTFLIVSDQDPHASQRRRFCATSGIFVALPAVAAQWPSGFVTSVPAGGVNSKVEAGIGARLSFA